MSMVLFASVVRVADGLPLSASTDCEQEKDLQETKRHLKGLSKKLNQFPDRCTLKSGPYNVNFIYSLGVGYLMVCTGNYPNVLAFCFLDELQKEFIITYDSKRISSAVRPYSFIEFDTFIQKTKQRYNSPRSLSTKINLADMQTEIKLRPPYQLSPEDLQAINGFSVRAASKYKGIAPTQMLEPATLPGIVSCVLSVLCGGLNLLRGVHAIESILQVRTYCRDIWILDAKT
ncbi:vesicle-trafficking protein SEC22a-like [Poecilia latipinna]|uniref:vesicle-trafficking protein SEC22a-like n=1 Tax=Poecilia latipinna TaxID=48699 RepID=UPI00072E532C|nr:PREDICTED: vesicle-trafficking protein SEC22a-like [Poecilia latipinna]XP_014882148.1 PREDICTED: vesicle-trafficking protein SEC22a-like [Poecilia latipinna]